MPSLLPGFEYDIFISYRHTDNRSGWVTQFVRHLQEELAATIKEPVSVYFDSNQHDGLLETHDVDDSLKSKLNCFIFIPIISQTYCDVNSFAWKHEFQVFRKNAAIDHVGIKILAHFAATKRFDWSLRLAPIVFSKRLSCYCHPV